MKKLVIIVLALMLTQACYVNAQPQWKFYLAFEDGIGAKDTMWFIWDTTASIYGIDTLLGEGNVDFEYDSFNVFTLLGMYPNIDSTKVFAIPYNEYFEKEILAFNYELPLKISWDTSLFHADYLPPEPVGWVNYARLYSQYFFFVNNNPPDQDFDMTLIDTVMSPDPSITEPFYWIPELHFPIYIFMHQEETTWIKNVLNIDVLDIIISPNPVKNHLKIKSNKPLNKACILNLNGRILLECDLSSDIFSLDISDLPNGIYFINLINYQNQNYYEKFIKTD
jgi:hypothetical protein